MNFSRAWKVVTAPSVPMHKTPDTRHRINHTINLAREPPNMSVMFGEPHKWLGNKGTFPNLTFADNWIYMKGSFPNILFAILNVVKRGLHVWSSPLVPPHTAATEPLSDIQSNSVNFIDWVWKRSRTIIRFSLCLAVKCAEVFQRELVQFIDMRTGIKLFFDDYLLMSVQIDIKMTLD